MDLPNETVILLSPSNAHNKDETSPPETSSITKVNEPPKSAESQTESIPKQICTPNDEKSETEKKYFRLMKVKKIVSILLSFGTYGCQFYGVLIPMLQFFEMDKNDFDFKLSRVFIGLSITWIIFGLLSLLLPILIMCPIKRLIKCQFKQNQFWCDIIDQTVYSVYLSTNVVLILIMLNEYCFVPNQDRPDDLQFLSPFQSLVLFPAFCVAYIAIKYVWVNVSPLCTSATTDISQRRWIADSLRVILIACGFLLSSFIFFLKFDGHCVLEYLNRPCKPIELDMTVESFNMMVLTSSVKTPENFHKDSHLIVKYCYKSQLWADHHKILSNPEWKKEDVSEKGWSFVAGNNFSFHEAWEKAHQPSLLENAHVRKLNSKSGQFLFFDCNNISPFQITRPNVTCFKRVKVQFRSESSLAMSYNTDYIFKYPESVEETPQWIRRESNADLSSIFSATSRESIEALKASFKFIDPELANKHFDVPQGVHLLNREPNVLQIKCKNSCYCYNCSKPNNKLPGDCQDVCRHVDMNFYAKSDRGALCSSDDSNRCDLEYNSITEVAKSLNSPKRELLSYQKPMEVKVRFSSRENRTQTVVYDPNMPMPFPKSSLKDELQDEPSCGHISYCVALFGITAFVIFYSLMLVLLCNIWRSKKVRRQRRNKAARIAA